MSAAPTEQEMAERVMVLVFSKIVHTVQTSTWYGTGTLVLRTSDFLIMIILLTLFSASKFLFEGRFIQNLSKRIPRILL